MRHLHSLLTGCHGAWLSAGARTLLLVTCLACERDPAPTTSAPPASAKVEPSTPAAPSDARRGAPAKALVPVEDLLRQSDVRITVSSWRDRRSLGEFLADGRSDTAWRPNPPDPAPWIQVVVPATVRVRELRLGLAKPSLRKHLKAQSRATACRGR